MASISPVKVAGTVTAIAVSGFLGYAVYFDYMRRHSPEFRKSLRKQQKKLSAVAEANAKAEKEKNAKALRDGFLRIQTEAIPMTPDQQEGYFAEAANQGEQLIAQGEEHYVEAALHFFRALRVYGNPGELLAVYQRVVPPPVLDMIIQLIALSTSTATGAGAGARPTATGAGAGARPTAASLETPAPAPASVEDLDEEKPAKEDAPSPNSASQGSGAEWEKVNQEAQE
ncbi:uncharacterized protein IAS62_002713 [Cryptococcus decagattii]|uniref:Mitochondrial import receptor subunit TOM20 n=1 Tax=Cryptococcus decagattii TaxID=1859122 RepID=A0ABZ2AY00_9TREE